MLRPLDKLLADIALSLDGHHRRHLEQVLPAALRVCAYLVRAKPHLLDRLVDEEKITEADFFILLAYNGISQERYEH